MANSEGVLRRRLIPLFLAALAGLALGGPGAASASGQAAVEAKTRVEASDPAAQHHIGGQAAEKPSTRRGTTTPSARIASGYRVATKAGPPIKPGTSGGPTA
ncbi:MAG: hypothetical protein MSC31_19185, partial [Solirubrobacteraceae bacterium MAG38_C4-C5]|nr:hypothetical protein [Candidatus Siliceabacter maunaloa]